MSKGLILSMVLSVFNGCDSNLEVKCLMVVILI